MVAFIGHATGPRLDSGEESLRPANARNLIRTGARSAGIPRADATRLHRWTFAVPVRPPRSAGRRRPQARGAPRRAGGPAVVADRSLWVITLATRITEFNLSDIVIRYTRPGPTYAVKITFCHKPGFLLIHR
jgi:hypothetical protein